jgi:hypothetical protein
MKGSVPAEAVVTADKDETQVSAGAESARSSLLLLVHKQKLSRALDGQPG